MMDTSALVAALIDDHEHHTISRARLSPRTRLPAIVLAETFAQLRRTFGQPVAVATAMLRPWTIDATLVLPTSAATVVTTFSRATELDLGGSIHDALIAQVCADHQVPLVTLDGRQHRLALALGVASTYLLA
ncbi:MAG: PIN domain-containing protein [Solirubrobacteraceae bacterium]